MTPGSSGVRAQLLVSGRVQGVGFRYFVLDEATDQGLAGWVRNLPDGRVEAVVEGTRSSVDALIARLRQGPPAAAVRSVEVEWQEATGDLSGFRVVR